MNPQLATSAVGAKQFSPARKRWENVRENLRSAVGAALTRELFHFSLTTPRSASTPAWSGRLRVGVSLSSLNLSWSHN
jgi:hypothetical protein